VRFSSAHVSWGLVFLRFKLSAALLLAAMVVSGVAHGEGWVHGGLNPFLATIGFIALGTLIGTRFAGITWQA